jgi:translation initiation factor IF-1
MVELVLLCAAAISIAVKVSLHNNKRRFAPLPARMRKRQP